MTKHLNTKGEIFYNRRKMIKCWFCGKSMETLTKKGYCQFCDANLLKYPTKKDHPLLSNKDIRCWYCQHHSATKSIVNQYGQCKRCRLNLLKYPSWESHQYPDFGPNDEKLTLKVLGHRKKFKIPNDESNAEQDEW